MHLWPSMRIRDSFKISYLKQIEWNLHRMKSDKNKNRDQQEPLLNDGDRREDGVGLDKEGTTPPALTCYEKACLICREILMIVSCCYCCFCCAACIDEDDA